MCLDIVEAVLIIKNIPSKFDRLDVKHKIVEPACRALNLSQKIDIITTQKPLKQPHCGFAHVKGLSLELVKLSQGIVSGRRRHIATLKNHVNTMEVIDHYTSTTNEKKEERDKKYRCFYAKSQASDKLLTRNQAPPNREIFLTLDDPRTQHKSQDEIERDLRWRFNRFGKIARIKVTQNDAVPRFRS